MLAGGVGCSVQALRRRAPPATVVESRVSCSVRAVSKRSATLVGILRSLGIHPSATPAKTPRKSIRSLLRMARDILPAYRSAFRRQPIHLPALRFIAPITFNRQSVASGRESKSAARFVGLGPVEGASKCHCQTPVLAQLSRSRCGMYNGPFPEHWQDFSPHAVRGLTGEHDDDGVVATSRVRRRTPDASNFITTRFEPRSTPAMATRFDAIIGKRWSAPVKRIRWR